MTVREWDPWTASAGQIEAMVRTLNDAIRADLPGDPLWENASIREYLAETVPGERRICWEAGGPGGDPAGYANLLLLGDTGVVEVFVHPEQRRRGLGRQLLRTACQHAYQEGLASLGVEAIGGTPAIGFWEAMGFRCGYVEMRSVLELSAVDWAKLGAMAAVPPGYRIECYPGGLPKEVLDAYAAAKASRHEVDGSEPELRPSSYDAHRLGESLQTLSRRGMKPYLVLAVHDGTGVVAGLSEVVVPAQHPTRADQYDTIVVPPHRELGLDRALKARMLFELRAAEARLTEVQTWNALEHDPLALVNSELGFCPDRQWREYEADVLELKSRLG